MQKDDIFAYLTSIYIFSGKITIEPIATGASGAKLYFVNDGRNKYVLKHMHKSFCTQSELYISYQREYRFYQAARELNLPYVPKLIYGEISDAYGIVLLLQSLLSIGHEQFDTAMQRKAVDICANFNGTPLEKFNSLELQFHPAVIDDFAAKASHEQWKNVINQHAGKFDEHLIDEIYRNISVVSPVLNNEPFYICHGDFHPENILTDGNKLFLCDWQNISIGKSVGDIAFFFSRGKGFGIDMDEDELLSYYCERLSFYTNTEVSINTLQRESYASYLLCTFSFWAYYLNNSAYENVAKYYKDMVRAYIYLSDNAE